MPPSYGNALSMRRVVANIICSTDYIGDQTISATRDVDDPGQDSRYT
jgi:hypothetical protein